MSPPANVDSDTVDATLASTLDVLDEAVNYRTWIVDLARPYLDGVILEVGAGHGTFTEEFVDIGRVDALEPSRHGSAILSDRFDADDRVSVISGDLSRVPDEAEYGSAVLVNVLEHIEDDAGALRSLFERLAPGAHLVLWVPAFNMLYSPFDRKLGHHRRYRLRQLDDLVEAAGFTVTTSRYVNLPGWFSWLLITRILRKEPTGGTMVALFDRYVVPIVRWVEERVRPPFGQSCFVVGRKPPAHRDAMVDEGTTRP